MEARTAIARRPKSFHLAPDNAAFLDAVKHTYSISRKSIPSLRCSALSESSVAHRQLYGEFKRATRGSFRRSRRLFVALLRLTNRARVSGEFLPESGTTTCIMVRSWLRWVGCGIRGSPIEHQTPCSTSYLTSNIGVSSYGVSRIYGARRSLTPTPPRPSAPINSTPAFSNASCKLQAVFVFA